MIHCNILIDYNHILSLEQINIQAEAIETIAHLNLVRQSFRNSQQLSGVVLNNYNLLKLAFNLQYLFLGKSLWAPDALFQLRKENAWLLRLQQMNLTTYT